MKDKLIESIVSMNEEKAIQLAQDMLDAGEEPFAVLNACREAMTQVGKKYEDGMYFLPELIVAGDILAAIGAIVKPRLTKGMAIPEVSGKIMIGTVAGDIHDIGKDIVSFVLDANNFEVIDLGVDVPVSTFLDRIKNEQPDILALSGFLTLAYDSMKATIQAINNAGLRNQVKIMIGGAPMDESVCDYIGADAFGSDANDALRIAEGWMGVN